VEKYIQNGKGARKWDVIKHVKFTSICRSYFSMVFVECLSFNSEKHFFNHVSNLFHLKNWYNTKLILNVWNKGKSIKAIQNKRNPHHPFIRNRKILINLIGKFYRTSIIILKDKFMWKHFYNKVNLSIILNKFLHKLVEIELQQKWKKIYLHFLIRNRYQKHSKLTNTWIEVGNRSSLTFDPPNSKTTKVIEKLNIAIVWKSCSKQWVWLYFISEFINFSIFLYKGKKIKINGAWKLCWKWPGSFFVQPMSWFWVDKRLISNRMNKRKCPFFLFLKATVSKVEMGPDLTRPEQTFDEQ